MNLTRNFSLEEFTLSETAARLRIKNEPDAAQLANLKVLAEALQRLKKKSRYRTNKKETMAFDRDFIDQLLPKMPWAFAVGAKRLRLLTKRFANKQKKNGEV